VPSATGTHEVLATASPCGHLLSILEEAIMKWNRRFGMVLVASLAMGGCGEAGVEARVGPGGRPDVATPAAVDSEATTLAPLNRSDVNGTAVVHREGGEAAVRLDVEGLEPGARYAAHVHEGRCATGGPIRLPLGRITADEDGAGAIRMRVDTSRLPRSDLFIQLHAPGGAPVACADVDSAAAR
jgi:hypothetical protein